jgi:hypothetical protein
MWIPQVLAPLILFTSLAVPAGIDVVGDDSRDRYVGSGGLLLPDTFAPETRDQVARCRDCRWRLRDPCPFANPEDPRLCSFTPMPCPADSQLLESLLSSDGGASWQTLGLMCVGPGGPRTVAEVGGSAQDAFEQAVPAQRLRSQPSRGIVPRLPVIWDSGQDGVQVYEERILGHTVRITTTPVWLWRFGDGQRLETAISGSRYPEMGVSHGYRRAGRYRVTCTTTWHATFTIDDLGPFPVQEPLIQMDAQVITVAPARAALIRR